MRLEFNPNHLLVGSYKIEAASWCCCKGTEFHIQCDGVHRHKQDFDYFVIFNDDDISRCLRVRGFGDVYLFGPLVVYGQRFLLTSTMFDLSF